MPVFSSSCCCLSSRKKINQIHFPILVNEHQSVHSQKDLRLFKHTHTHTLCTYASRSRFKLRSPHICHGTAPAISNQWRRAT